MSIFDGLFGFGGRGIGQYEPQVALFNAQVFAMHEEKRRIMQQTQYEYRPGEIIEIRTGVSHIVMGSSHSTKRQHCSNCGAPYKPVCDYCGS